MKATTIVSLLTRSPEKSDRAIKTKQTSMGGNSVSNYDDPRWYEQDNSSDQSSPPDPTDRFPQRIHNDNDALNTSYRGIYDAQSPLSQKLPTRQFSPDSSRNAGGLGTGTGRGGRPNSRV